MSAMMAANAPGPIPVPQQHQFNTQNVTMSRGHTRQPSASQRPQTSGGDPSRKDSRGGRNPPTQGGVPLESYDESAGPRVVGPGGSTQAKNINMGGPPGQPRVRAPSTGQRPSTSYGASTGAAGLSSGPTSGHRQSQSQGQPSSFRPTAQQQDTARASQQPQSQPQPTARFGPSNNPPNQPSQQQQSQQQQPQQQPQQLSPPSNGQSQSQQTGTRSSSFPHAFERWEMLSSRWEGLTGYWVSRLEQNRHELSHLPLEQEMSRQITDLAAAGANLFQALIELQRLRASSERKFQRWFFETRADQERAREMSSELERSLRVERQKRADAVTTIQRLEKEKATADKLVEESRRELQISKEECRRAWEELGRREQEEREKTNSLREGHPTLVGGIQVTPMPMPGVPSRSGSGRRTSSGAAYASQQQQEPYAQQQQQSQQQQEQPQSQNAPAVEDYYEDRQPLHHESDISDLHQQQPQTSTAGATATSTTTPGSPSPAYPPPQQQSQQQQGFYHQQQTSLHQLPLAQEQPPNPSPVSYITDPNVRPQTTSTQTSEQWELDEDGNIIVDEHGNPVIATTASRRRNRRGGEDQGEQEYDTHGDEQQWSSYPSYDGIEYGDTSGGAAYSSGGVGIGSGWESIPRHRHPTRLSDVLEEEERTTLSEGRRSR